MNKEQKAAAIEEVATQIQESEAVIAVDYRGISVPQAAELRTRLTEAGARFRVVKNTLTERAADQAGADPLKEVLEGPTAFTFVLADGDVALAAKALATFRRENDVLAFKGGVMGGDAITPEQIEALSRLPARDVLHGQLVAMIASPITGLVRGLNALISGLAIQLGQIRDQGLVGGDEPAAEEAPAEETAAAEDSPAEDSEDSDDTSDDTSSDDTSSDDAAEDASEAGEDVSPEEAADDASPEDAAEDASPEPEASAEGDGTETDATDAPSEGDKTE